jgi:hypothetical protein
VNYGELTEEKEDAFLRALIDSYHVYEKQSTPGQPRTSIPVELDPALRRVIHRLILVSQSFVKNRVSPHRKRIKVSIRDMIRAWRLFLYFYMDDEIVKGGADHPESSSRAYFALILSLAVSYYFRLPVDLKVDGTVLNLRKTYVEEINALFKPRTSLLFKPTIEKELRRYELLFLSNFFIFYYFFFGSQFRF